VRTLARKAAEMEIALQCANGAFGPALVLTSRSLDLCPAQSQRRELRRIRLGAK
jgi:hypothetical protein